LTHPSTFDQQKLDLALTPHVAGRPRTAVEAERSSARLGGRGLDRGYYGKLEETSAMTGLLRGNSK